MRPVSHTDVGRNVFGSVARQAHRFQRGFATSMGPNSVCTVVVPLLLL
jgi:hypothetical protein